MGPETTYLCSVIEPGRSRALIGRGWLSAEEEDEEPESRSPSPYSKSNETFLPW